MSKQDTDRIRGRLAIHPRGFGFLDPANGEDSSFVPPPQLEGFLAGDIVTARQVTEKDGRTSVTDLQLVQRLRQDLFGTFAHQRGKPVLEVEPGVANGPWQLAKAPKGLAPGEFVLARIQGKSAEWLRTVSVREAGLVRVLSQWQIRSSYPAACSKEAKRSAPSKIARRDLRQVPTITIDGPTSRDLDDALAVLPPQPDGAVRILVSIADVDSMVPVGSALDKEARARGTSVYLPGQVIPMLPPELSEGSLSLLEGEERGALTVELRIDPQGDVTAVDIYESLIKNHARLTYDDAAAFLDHGATEAVPEEIHDTLRWLRTAAARLSTVRAARGGVTTFSRDEVKLKLIDGEPTGLEAVEENCAHRLIERLMVATNEAVARWLEARGLPALYRSMPEPEPARVHALSEFAWHFGFEAGFGQRLTPRGMAAFEDQFQTSNVAPAMRTVVRRALGRASYSPVPAPHFALAAPLYLHFTSPIRRYADLAVHRLVKAHLRGERTLDPADPALFELADHLNDAAYRAKKAEFDRQDQLLARLFSSRLGERHQANVVSVSAFGLRVQLAGLGVTGTVASDALSGGPFEFDDATQTLEGRDRSYVIGDGLTVEVAATDETQGRIELIPAERKKRRGR